LVIEELDLCHFDKGVGDSHEGELWQEDEDGERDNLGLTVNAVLSGDAQPPPLGQTSSDHYYYVEDKAYPHSLQQCDASGVLGIAPDGRDEGPVIDDEACEHEDRYECGEARGRDLEVRAHVSVQGCTLLDEER